MGAAPPQRAHPRGFTLIELIIVVMMIGILATLAMPKYRQSVLKAQGTEVVTRVEQINVALKLYEADHDSVPTGIGPVGSAPPWLAAYMTHNHFLGPASISWQFVKASGTVPATLIIAAGSLDEELILLAAAGALGNLSVTLGGGSSLLVTLTE